MLGQPSGLIFPRQNKEKFSIRPQTHSFRGATQRHADLSYIFMCGDA